MPLHLIYTAVFGVAFPFPGILWSSLYCGVSLLWVGLYRWLVKVSWLGKLVLVSWWVELYFFSLKCNEVPVVSFGVYMGLAWLWAAQGCVHVLLKNLCGMFCSETCWPLGGAWFQCRYGSI